MENADQNGLRGAWRSRLPGGSVLPCLLLLLGVGLTWAAGCGGSEEPKSGGETPAVGIAPDAGPESAAQPAGTRVLVVANGNDAASAELAERYALVRSVPPSHVLRLPLPGTERITRDEFRSGIAQPLAEWWRACPPRDLPDFILLMKGVPHRIDGSGGLAGTHASVDSDLCYLPRLAAGFEVPPETRRRNPYHGRPGAEFPVFRQGAYDICLVTRLDGFDATDAWRLVERALAAEREPPDPSRGLFLLDTSGGTGPGNEWLVRAADAVSGRGARVQLDRSGSFVREADSLAGYASWGSNDGSYRRDCKFTWRPGALVTTYVSSSARTFAEPPADWAPGPADRLDLLFGGSTQSLIADLVRSGATGACGQAHEPFLDGCPRPDILFPAYLEGRNLAEAFYLSLHYLSWQSVVLGDPICAPYAARP